MFLAVGLPSIVSADTVVFGRVSGEWKLQNSPYIVTDSIYVAQSDTLQIDPGVRVVFTGNYRFQVHGLLLAIGGLQPDSHIYIGSEDIVWQGIVVASDANVGTTISYCDIKKALVGIEVNDVDILIEGNSIEAGAAGIVCRSASPTITNNRTIRAISSSTGQGTATAINLINHSSPVISNNTTIEAQSSGYSDAYGIKLSENCSPWIESNWIEVKAEGAAYGIWAFRTTQLDIIRNIVRVFSNVAMRCIWTNDATNIRIQSNDMFINGSSMDGIGIHLQSGSQATIMNNIVIGNDGSIGDRTQGSEIHQSSGYNDYWHQRYNHDPHPGNWEGGEGEISLDPLFVNASIDRNSADYHLSWPDLETIIGRSPCIDAGNPNLRDPEDPYNTRSDIGCFPYIYNPLGAPTEIVKQYQLLTAYPNPFNRTTTIAFGLALPGQVNVVAFDLAGRMVDNLWSGPLPSGNHSLLWKANGIPAGEYVIRLNGDADHGSVRVVFLP
jgi:hypothetical protein